MVVAVMGVGAVRVLVLEVLVTVRMAVHARHRRLVDMQVVPVVVRMGVLVLERIVAVAVVMAFGDVQVDGGTERCRGDRDEMEATAVTEPECHERPDEWRRGEQRPRARRAEPALCL